MVNDFQIDYGDLMPGFTSSVRECDECDEELELDGVEDEDYFIKDGSRICRKCYMDAIECEEEDDES